MKIVFVSSQDENLGVGYLSSVLKKEGHDVRLVFDPQLFNRAQIQNRFLGKLFDVMNENVKKIVEIKPDLICFSVLTMNYQWALNMAEKIKQKVNIPIVFGGVHVTSVPETVIKSSAVDMICLGEGEEALSELVNRMSKGEDITNIKNLWIRTGERIIKNEVRPLIEDLDTLPYPDKDLFFSMLPKHYREYFLTMTSRGCPFGCTFCYNNTLKKIYINKGKYLRRFSVRYVIEQLKFFKKYHPKHIFFMDDVFAIEAKWLKEFAKEYPKYVKLPFTCFGHVQTVNREIASLLKESGCNLIMFGIQSGNQIIRRRILKRYETNEAIKEAAKVCHEFGLKFSVDHILNLPEEEEESIIESLNLYNVIRPTAINVFGLIYFPNTEIVDIAGRLGVLTSEDRKKIHDGKSELYASTMMIYSKSKNFQDNYRKYALLFSIIPFLPKSLAGILINKAKIRKAFAKIPMFLVPLVKMFANMREGQSFMPFIVLKNQIYWMYKILRLKCFGKYFNE